MDSSRIAGASLLAGGVRYGLLHLTCKVMGLRAAESRQRAILVAMRGED